MGDTAGDDGETGGRSWARHPTGQTRECRFAAKDDGKLLARNQSSSKGRWWTGAQADGSTQLLCEKP